MLFYVQTGKIIKIRNLSVCRIQIYEKNTDREYPLFTENTGVKAMDLFEYAKSKTLDQESPLASRLRPRTLDEVVGQQHIVGKDKLLYRAIKADKLTSVIFYGPPGTGKTTLQKSSPILQAPALRRSMQP